jgi:hypothetical protein
LIVDRWQVRLKEQCGHLVGNLWTKLTARYDQLIYFNGGLKTELGLDKYNSEFRMTKDVPEVADLLNADRLVRLRIRPIRL